MEESKFNIDIKKVDTKELEIPETAYIRDIENKVFQSIILQTLSEIEGISLAEGTFFDHFLGRSAEGTGIYAEQDEKQQSVNVKLAVNILYGLKIPEKAEEIQNKIAEKITELTGLHVASVHVVFKNVITEDQLVKQPAPAPVEENNVEEEYKDEF